MKKQKGNISNIKRLRQIVNILAKHGLGQLIKLAGLDRYVSLGKRLWLRDDGADADDARTNPQRLVAVFEELGPTFIKLGQILSTRKDVLPKEYIAEFEKLQDSTVPLPFEQLDQVFAAEHGKPAAEAFERIDTKPIAAGSIGQVYDARLRTGEEVVVKIRKPEIEHVINADVKILYFIGNRVKKLLFEDNQMCDPVEIVKLFELTINNELDFSMEGRNLERFKHNAKNNPGVHFPKVYWDYSSSRVLVMEKIKGIPVGDVQGLRKNNHDLKKIAYNLFDICMRQMFIDAFFHADFHPGNIIIMENDVIGIIDCGMAGYFENHVLDAFTSCFAGMFLKDYELMVKGYLTIGTITEDIDMEAFKNDLRTFTEYYREISLNAIGIGNIFDDGLHIATKYSIKIPPIMFFTSKALVLLDGTVRNIDPGFDFVAHSTNFAQTLVAEKKFDPKKITADMVSFLTDTSGLLQNLPKQSARILSLIEKQKINLNITVSGSENFHRKLNAYATSISLSFISAGLGIASSIVIQAKITPLVYGVSALGLFGYLMASVLGLWVVIVIFGKK